MHNCIQGYLNILFYLFFDLACIHNSFSFILVYICDFEMENILRVRFVGNKILSLYEKCYLFISEKFESPETVISNPYTMKTPTEGLVNQMVRRSAT